MKSSPKLLEATLKFVPSGTHLCARMCLHFYAYVFIYAHAHALLCAFLCNIILYICTCLSILWHTSSSVMKTREIDTESFTILLNPCIPPFSLKHQ